jgi:hypothetical protein
VLRRGFCVEVKSGLETPNSGLGYVVLEASCNQVERKIGALPFTPGFPPIKARTRKAVLIKYKQGKYEHQRL